jgi:predicted dehydrogenase
VLTGVVAPSVYAAGSDTIQVALIGCGGRGTGAAANALSSKGGGIKLVAMADVSEGRLKDSFKQLHGDEGRRESVDVPADRQFLGLDAYKKAMDCLKPGDIAIFGTPPAFRWVHFTYAIEKGLNVFMEKPVTVDGPTSKRMMALGEAASKKNLKVGVGLMSPGAGGTGQARARRRDRRGDSPARVSHARADRLLRLAAEARGGERFDVPGAALPQFSVGGRRLLFGFLHPHHRPSRLDEECVAGEGPGAGRAALSPAR